MDGFTVTPGTPAVVSVNPGAGQQGQQQTVTITGQFTHFAQGATTATFGPGINVVSLTVSSPTSATAVINIDPLAPTGASAVGMTTGSETATLSNGFTVIAGTPVLLSVSPNSGQQAQQNLSVNIVGQYTHFAQGTTAANFGAAIAVISLTVNSPTSATAVLNISAAAATGARTVTLTTGSEIDSLANGFMVTAETLAISSFTPQSGTVGSPVTIQGQGFSTTASEDSVQFNGVPATVAFATATTLIVSVPPGATTGSISVTVGSQTATSSSNFTVLASSSETDSVLFSLLNTAPPPGQVAHEADSVIFSLLNTATPPGQVAHEADSVIFSLLNTNTGSTGAELEADGIIFSVQNTATAAAIRKPSAGHAPVVHPPALPDSDGDGYPDAVEIALGSDPNDPNSIPQVQPVPEVESAIFSVQNEGRPAARANAVAPVPPGEARPDRVGRAAGTNVGAPLGEPSGGPGSPGPYSETQGTASRTPTCADAPPRTRPDSNAGVARKSPASGGRPKGRPSGAAPRLVLSSGSLRSLRL